VPKLVDEVVKSMNLEQINRDNLLQGKDRYGQDMPDYSNPEYGFIKFRMNTRNRGKWDLKLTGEYHKGIFIKILGSEVEFRQRLRNAKVQWINLRLEKLQRDPLGIEEIQMKKLLKENAPLLKKKIEDSIKNV